MSGKPFPKLRHFVASEFDHPELMDREFLTWLDAVRERCGIPFILFDDARTPAENEALRARGSSPTSLHLLGRAVDFLPDLKKRNKWEAIWKITEAVMEVPPPRNCGIEWELVFSAKDQHCHLALFPVPRESRIVIKAD